MNLFFQNSVSVETLRLGIYVFVIFLLSVTISVVRHEFLKARFLFVEIIFLLVLATTLARLILSQNLPEGALNATYFMVMLISGFAMMRLFIRDYDRWKKIGELAADLAVANEELRELDRLKSDFVSIASHQLRTPVSVMKGYLSLIGEGAYGKVTPEIREKVGQMYRMNDRLVHLINNMLNVSRIEKERIDFSCSGFDLDDVIVDIVDEMSYKAKEKGLSLAFTKGADDKTAHVHADKEKVSEVLTNLIDNAVKYTERGGITVSVAVDLKKEIAEVRVTDTGLGVPADAMRHLFGKFYRAKRDVNLRTQGTGLGLYVCKTFVEGMGGTIVVEKTSERGTTFMFTVPMVPKGACAEDLG
jgi:signal transduction histidine kinase